jgi:hypothetical protein
LHSATYTQHTAAVLTNPHSSCAALHAWGGAQQHPVAHSCHAVHSFLAAPSAGRQRFGLILVPV